MYKTKFSGTFKKYQENLLLCCPFAVILNITKVGPNLKFTKKKRQTQLMRTCLPCFLQITVKAYRDT